MGRTEYDPVRAKAVRKRTAMAALMIFVAVPALIALSTVLDGGKYYMIISVGVVICCMLPFFMVFEKRKPKAREIVLVAMISAITVAAHMFLHVTVPLQIGTAMVIVAGIAMGPEAGFLVGALSRFVCNFYMGQGPWTPWQMFSWGMIGFLSGLLYKAGIFGKIVNTEVNEKGKRQKPVRLCIFGFFAGFLFGWVMNLYHIIGYVSPITWQAVLATYASSFYFDISHGICTALILWLVGEHWIRKLLRIKKKFGLEGEYHHYTMPPAKPER